MDPSPSAPRVHIELTLVEEPVLVTASTPPQPIAKPDRDVPDRPPPVPAHVAVRRNQKNPAIPVLIGALIVAALVVVAIILLMHFNNPHSHAHAPWSNPGAPNVHPTPLSDQ